MSTTGNVNFNITNQAFEPATPAVGVLFFQGVTKRGPVLDPKDLITTPKRFRKLFGNIDIASDFPLLCQRAIQKGAILRVNRILGTGSAVAQTAAIGAGTRGNTGAPTFTLSNITPKDVAQGQVDHHTPANVAIGDIFKMTIGGGDPLYFRATAATAANVIAGFIAAITAEKAAHPTGAWAVAEVVPSDGTTYLITTGKNNVAITFADTVLATPQSLFTILGKAAGADYNNARATISNATNQNASYFNLTISFTNDTLVTETYENLVVVNGTALASTYLEKITKNSDLVSVLYSDTSMYNSFQMRPLNGTYALSGGADGAAPTITEYTGTADAQTGFDAFDPYDEAYAIACPEVSESDMTGLSTAGEAYAAKRKDLRYYQHLDNTNTTSAALISEKPSIDSQYIIFTAGGMEITHPISGNQVSISELADVLGNMAYIHQTTKKPWNAFFGPEFGVLNNCLGVTNNFGATALFNDLDLLAQHRINMVIKRGGSTMLWDDYTSQTDPSPENFACLENLLIYLVKILRRPLERKLGQPTDFILLKDVFFTIEPIIKEVVEGRGISTWTWEGDQFATSFDDLQVNTAANMQMGKITANLRIVTIAPLKEISVNIILTKAGVTFEQV